MEPTHDPALAELLSFFDFAHLRERTPHLAAASEPFHRLAHIMAPDPSAAVDGLRATILRMDCEPGREAAAAALKLRRLEAALVAPDYAVIDSAGPEDFLRTLLEAKDCAVRAALVRHRAEQADGLTSSKTVAVADLPGLLAGVERLAVQHNRTIDEPERDPSNAVRLRYMTDVVFNRAVDSLVAATAYGLTSEDLISAATLAAQLRAARDERAKLQG